MAIDKSLYQAPQGLEQLAEGEPDIEVEIENPEAVRISADGEEIFNMEYTASAVPRFCSFLKL